MCSLGCNFLKRRICISLIGENFIYHICFVLPLFTALFYSIDYFSLLIIFVASQHWLIDLTKYISYFLQDKIGKHFKLGLDFASLEFSEVLWSWKNFSLFFFCLLIFYMLWCFSYLKIIELGVEMIFFLLYCLAYILRIIWNWFMWLFYLFDCPERIRLSKFVDFSILTNP